MSVVKLYLSPPKKNWKSNLAAKENKDCGARLAMKIKSQQPYGREGFIWERNAADAVLIFLCPGSRQPASLHPRTPSADRRSR